MKTFKANVNVIACGGAGISIVQKAMRMIEALSADHEELPNVCLPWYIDSSDSDLGEKSPNDSDVFLIPNLDGNGKLRKSENLPTTVAETKKIIKNIPKAKCNIIVTSLTGGSGSVLSTLITNDLLDSKDTVTVVICVDSSDSSIEIKNSLATLKGFKANALKRNRPLAIRYFQNSKDELMSTIDGRIAESIFLLQTAFSGKVAKQDSNDIQNFFDYHRVTDSKSDLAYLNICRKKLDELDGEHVISVLSLSEENNPWRPEKIYGYSSAGVVSPGLAKSIGDEDMPIIFSMSRGPMDLVINMLEKRVHELIEKEKEQEDLIDSCNVSSEDLSEDGLMF